MDRETIRDARGRLIGFIELSARGDKIVRDSAGRYLGKYDAANKMTIDNSGKFLYRGDQAAMLLSNIH